MVFSSLKHLPILVFLAVSFVFESYNQQTLLLLLVCAASLFWLGYAKYHGKLSSSNYRFLSKFLNCFKTPK